MATEEASVDDSDHMQAALALARRGLGRVWPNPAVGCVIVRDRRVLGRGWTQPGGRPHAETEALRRAGAAAAGATAYVSLEPCNHHGVTPPCTEALIDAGIARCVIAVADPDQRVNGGGLARLRDAGIQVTVGVREEAAAELNAGFFMRCNDGRPLFTLKMASSLDGRIATASGESRWITGEQARRVVHHMRACHDGVLIGSGTAIADDPDLGCRLPGMEDRSPLRVVADARLRISADSRLVATAAQRPTWVLTQPEATTPDATTPEATSKATPEARPGPEPDAHSRRRAVLTERGVTVVAVEPAAGGGLDPLAMAKALGERGLTRVMIEGGGRLAASFLAAGLIDRIAWFHGPLILGADGIPAMDVLGLTTLAAAPTFTRTGTTVLGDDVLATLRRVG